MYVRLNDKCVLSFPRHVFYVQKKQRSLEKVPNFIPTYTMLQLKQDTAILLV